jgi:hypothetical protein
VTSLRLWVSILALTAFLAGLACGPLVTAWLFPPARAAASGPFADYERLLVQKFSLAPERREPLHVILDQYRRDIEGIKDQHMADYMTSMEPALREKGLQCREEIRDKVLPESERPEFDRLVSGLPLPNHADPR